MLISGSKISAPSVFFTASTGSPLISSETQTKNKKMKSKANFKYSFLANGENPLAIGGYLSTILNCILKLYLWKESRLWL